MTRERRTSHLTPRLSWLTPDMSLTSELTSRRSSQPCRSRERINLECASRLSAFLSSRDRRPRSHLGRSLYRSLPVCSQAMTWWLKKHRWIAWRSLQIQTTWQGCTLKTSGQTEEPTQVNSPLNQAPCISTQSRTSYSTRKTSTYVVLRRPTTKYAPVSGSCSADQIWS